MMGRISLAGFLAVICSCIQAQAQFYQEMQVQWPAGVTASFRPKLTDSQLTGLVMCPNHTFNLASWTVDGTNPQVLSDPSIGRQWETPTGFAPGTYLPFYSDGKYISSSGTLVQATAFGNNVTSGFVDTSGRGFGTVNYPYHTRWGNTTLTRTVMFDPWGNAAPTDIHAMVSATADSQSYIQWAQGDLVGVQDLEPSFRGANYTQYSAVYKVLNLATRAVTTLQGMPYGITADGRVFGSIKGADGVSRPGYFDLTGQTPGTVISQQAGAIEAASDDGWAVCGSTIYRPNGTSFSAHVWPAASSPADMGSSLAGIGHSGTLLYNRYDSNGNLTNFQVFRLSDFAAPGPKANLSFTMTCQSSIRTSYANQNVSTSSATYSNQDVSFSANASQILDPNLDMGPYTGRVSISSSSFSHDGRSIDLFGGLSTNGYLPLSASFDLNGTVSLDPTSVQSSARIQWNITAGEYLAGNPYTSQLQCTWYLDVYQGSSLLAELNHATQAASVTVLANQNLTVHLHGQSLNGSLGFGAFSQIGLTMTPILLDRFPGDATGDGNVNFSDYLSLEQTFNTTVPAWTGADFTGDGHVNFSDYLVLEQHFGDHSAVPEPMTLALLTLGGLLITHRRK